MRIHAEPLSVCSSTNPCATQWQWMLPSSPLNSPTASPFKAASQIERPLAGNLSTYSVGMCTHCSPFHSFFFKVLIYIIRLLKKAKRAQRMHDVHSPACVVFWGCILSLRPVSLACTSQALSENRRSSWDIMPPMNILKNRSLYSLQGFFSLFFRSAVICSTHCYPSPEAILKMDVLEKAAPHLCTRVWRGKVAAILFHLCKNYCKLREKNLKNVSHYLKGQHVFRWMSLCWI